MSYKICVIKGDGIGVDVVDATISVLKALPIHFEFIEAKAGYRCYEEKGTTIPDETIKTCRNADAVLFGAVTTPPDPKYKSAIVTLRKALDLYANLRPIKSCLLPGSRQNVDLFIIRENTEGLYCGEEEDLGDRAISKRIITRKASERIVRYAFEFARKKGKKKVIFVHKANILKATCGLFLRTARDVARNYPEIEATDMLVDAMAMRLIKDPENFDVLVTTNMFGDILSDEACMLVGGLGLAPSGNIGDTCAIFEPVHGSSPDIAGKGIANPLACILAGKMMLEYLGEHEAAKKLAEAVEKVLTVAKDLTPDLGGNGTTKTVTEKIVVNVEHS